MFKLNVPDLKITVEGVEVVPFAATPTLGFKLCVVNRNRAEVIHSVVLKSQIQIEVARRQYSAADQERLRDLFGEPARWGRTLINLLWANTSTVIPQFTGSTTAVLQVPCTFDFTVATTKYFDGLAEGEVPVCLMFSGTVFYEDEEANPRVAPISWDKEARFRLLVKVWKEMMDAYYPNIAWLCVRRDVFAGLHRFKMDRGIPTWEQVFETMLGELNRATVSR